MKLFALHIGLLAVGCCMAAVLPETKVAKLAKASNDLAFDLLKSSKGEKNVFISPFSISTALALVYLGADGTTSQAMRRVLKYDRHGLTEQDVHSAFRDILQRLKGQDYVLSSYNGALVQKDFPILETFERALKEQYSAKVENVDFAAQGLEVQAKINADIETATRGKIKDFLEEPPSSDAKLFLLNAVYFLGSWKNTFKADSTHKATFYNNGVQEKKVQMMNREGFYLFSNNNDLDASVVVLPYKGEESASMIVVLPNERKGLDALQQRITGESLEKVLEGSRFYKLDLSVPKFSLEYKTDLVKSLRGLGLGELFGAGANLSRIAGDKARLSVSKVLHKAVIDVDEKGTEAAGATGVEIVPYSYSFPTSVRVDHPFLFFIRDDSSGLILFSGRVDEL